MPYPLEQHDAEERRMKIAICASMVFAEKMLEVKRQLE